MVNGSQIILGWIINRKVRTSGLFQTCFKKLKGREEKKAVFRGEKMISVLMGQHAEGELKESIRWDKLSAMF